MKIVNNLIGTYFVFTKNGLSWFCLKDSFKIKVTSQDIDENTNFYTVKTEFAWSTDSPIHTVKKFKKELNLKN